MLSLAFTTFTSTSCDTAAAGEERGGELEEEGNLWRASDCLRGVFNGSDINSSTLFFLTGGDFVLERVRGLLRILGSRNAVPLRRLRMCSISFATFGFCFVLFDGCVCNESGIHTDDFVTATVVPETDADLDEDICLSTDSPRRRLYPDVVNILVDFFVTDLSTALVSGPAAAEVAITAVLLLFVSVDKVSGDATVIFAGGDSFIVETSLD
mmetsp:Transcript_19564/g.22497  ORF Transcript_19564/g.22497 Transcript_19564/m.22497 type:complete len:211 (-) Transcript_19564:149-781(-)